MCGVSFFGGVCAVKNKMALVLIGAQVMMLGGVQARLWWGQNGIHQSRALDHEIQMQTTENTRLTQRNRRLGMEIEALSVGGAAIEGRARFDLGMVRQGETLFLIPE